MSRYTLSEISKAAIGLVVMVLWLMMIFTLLAMITQPVPCRNGRPMVNGYCVTDPPRETP